MRRPLFLWQAAILGLTVVFALSFDTGARAQRTPDPYNIVGDGNLGYQDYMYSVYPNGIGYSPNQGILQGNRSGQNRANQFSNYVQELDGVGSDSPYGPSTRGRGGIEPYYKAHHQFDDAFNRVYTPNEAADKVYYKDQQSRTDKYLAYLRESDPKKRAMLYKEYTQESLRAARDIGSGSVRAASRGSAAPRPSASGSATGTSLPPSAPGSSNLAAPRPSSRTGASPTRRPSAASTARSGSASLALPETPDQILRRAELMDRANRALPPSATPSRPTTPPAPR
jgi:hypothetical protein